MSDRGDYRHSERNEMQTERDCCYLYGDAAPCKLPATVEIVANTGHFEDTTDACDDHIGRLLGSITNREWGTYTFTVVPLNRPGPFIVEDTVSAEEANCLYGERFGVDWIYAESTPK